MSKAIGYAVLPAGGYPDTASDYIACATRDAVAAELVDYGYTDNPSIWVYKVTRGQTAAAVIAELSTNPDPYPDFVVSPGARGGVVWSNA